MKIFDKLMSHFSLIMSVIVAGSTTLMWWPIVTRADNFKTFLFYYICASLMSLGYKADKDADLIKKQQVYIDQYVRTELKEESNHE